MPSSTSCASRTRDCPAAENCQCSSTSAPQVRTHSSVLILWRSQICICFGLTDSSVVLKLCSMGSSPSVWLITIRSWFVLGQRCDLRGGAINAAYTILLLCDSVLLMCDSSVNKNSSFILCRAVNPAPAELNPHSSSRSLPYSCFRPRWETLMLMLL